MPRKEIALTEERLKEIIIKTMRKVIHESMGVNDEMELFVDRMIPKIQELIRKAPIEYDDKLKVNYKLVSYSDNLYGKEFSWTVRAFVYPNDTDLRNDSSVIQGWGQASSDGDRIYMGWVNFPMTKDGWFDANAVADTVYHETLHLLKRLKTKKLQPHFNFTAIANWEYQVATGLAKDVAVICYLCDGEEQDAYVNGLYGQLKGNYFKMDIDVRRAFENSEVFQKMKEIEAAIVRIREASDEDLNACISKYEKGEVKLTRAKLLKMGRNALTRLYKKTNLVFNRFRSFMHRYRFESNPPMDVINI